MSSFRRRFPRLIIGIIARIMGDRNGSANARAYSGPGSASGFIFAKR